MLRNYQSLIFVSLGSLATSTAFMTKRVMSLGAKVGNRNYGGALCFDHAVAQVTCCLFIYLS